MNDTNLSKKYIKNLIIKGLEGRKINTEESEELEKVVLNFNQAEWRNFKIIGKEAIKEFVDKSIDEKAEIPADWKNEVKNFSHSLINFFSSLASEELIMENVRLEKEKVPYEQRIVILAPLYTKQLEKIVARKPVKQISNYHKAEVSLVKKVKQLETMYKMAKLMGGKPNKQATLAGVKKVINIFKSLSAEEIKVAKDKGKILVNKYLETRARAEFQQYPELKPLSKSFINFWDTVCDEELIAEGINLISKATEISLKHFDFEKLGKIRNWQESVECGLSLGEEIGKKLQESGMENRAKKLLINLTNHLNVLAKEEANNDNISPTEEQSITQKLSTSYELSRTNNSAGKNGAGLSFLSPVATFGSIETGNGNPDSKFNFLEEATKEFSTVKSKEIWYKNPWFIGFSVVSAFIIGGLAVWFFTKKKDKVKLNYN